MKLCIIGSTGHVNYVFSGLKEEKDIRIAGIAPGSPGENVDKVVERAVSSGHSPEVFSDYVAMLDKIQPDIVAIACYFNDHAKITAQALKRGIHVFVEKPVATTLADLEMVREAYRNANVQLAAMFGIRYTPPFLTAWKAVQDGAVGSVRLLHGQKSYKLGNRAELYKNRTTYGGTIPWVGSHAIDWVRWFSGERFESVFASHSTVSNRDHGDLEMTAMCHFSMTNEVVASVSIDYLRPQQASGHGDDRIRVAGTSGVIEVKDQRVLLMNTEHEGIQELPLLPKQEIFADFLKQIKGQGTCLVSAEDSFAVTEACLKAVVSADEKRVLLFD